MVNECTSETAITLHFTHMHCLGIFEITALWPGQWRVDPWRGTEERGKDKGTLPGHPHIAPPEPPLTESIQLNFFWMWIGQAHTWSRSPVSWACKHACMRASYIQGINLWIPDSFGSGMTRIHLWSYWIHCEGFAAFLDSRADQSFRPGCPTQ